MENIDKQYIKFNFQAKKVDRRKINFARRQKKVDDINHITHYFNLIINYLENTSFTC